MLTYILLGVAATLLLVVLGLIIVVALQPADFRITRKLAMAAPAAAIFPHVNELAKWRAWSPWEKLDPDLKRTYEGPASGEGAKYAWTGNPQVGEGRMTITESRPSSLVRIRLEFIKPFQATNSSEFTFEPNGNGTLVTWNMQGCNNLMAKAFHLLMNMDKLVGKDFEKGLSELKAIVEAKAEKRSWSLVIDSSFEFRHSTFHPRELPAMSIGTQAPKSPVWMYWTGWVVTVLPSLMLVFSAVMKFVGPPEVKEGFTKAGWNTNLLLPLGITELVCTILYLVPQTSTLGAVLLTGYMGGAICHHLRLGEPIVVQVVFGMVIWLGLYLREPRLRAILPIRT